MLLSRMPRPSHRVLALAATLAIVAAGHVGTLAPRLALQLAASQTITDPSHDASDPRADIVAASAAYNGNQITLSMTVAQPTDPLTDPSWKPAPPPGLFTSALWAVWTTSTYPSNPDFLVGIAATLGVLVAPVIDTTSKLVCEASPSFDGTSYSVTFAATCIGSPAQFKWSAGMSYQANPGSTTPPVSEVDPATGPAGPVFAATSGYWMLDADGTIYGFGSSKVLGNPSTLLGGALAVDLEPTAGDAGYWITDDQGRVYGYGDAQSFGNADRGSFKAGELVASLAPTPTGKGYWLFTNQGRVLAFGDATFFGDVSKLSLAGPILGSVATPSGKGYYMVGSDGGVFTFGDAAFFGSMGNRPLNQPVRGLVPTANNTGYWLIAADGGIFAFGSASFKGSVPGALPPGGHLNQAIIGAVRYGNGYLMVAADGGIFSFSDLPFLGSLGATPPAHPIAHVAVG
jgi:hypothetical protein